MLTPSVRIRMYKQGLGDCFLLTFPRQDGSNYYLLIDCGAVTGTDPQSVIAAANDIFETTRGHLDLVVGTHEHWDHLSGFNQARETFDKFTIGNVWLAWTEDPTNNDAQDLVKKRAAKVTALRSALMHMNAAVNIDLIKSIQQVLSFFGEDDGSGAGAGLEATGGRALSTSSEAMRYLRTRHDAVVHFCDPQKDPPHTLEGVDGVRVYVFGPPADPKLLKQDLPSKTGQETYGVTSKSAEGSFFAAIQSVPGASGPSAASGSTGSGAPSSDSGSIYTQFQPLAYPFDDFYQVSKAEAQNGPDDFYRIHYGFNDRDADRWRRIDQDWLNMTSELALNLDSDTNNTSLVLAFELGEPGSGRVLLFAADAQVGNWLSWGGLSWTLDVPGQPQRTITASDLLRRTVLYKVGHHGSHNATLSAQGLELMTSDELAAMLPVVQDMARKKGWDAMPFDRLLDNLKLKTKGRIMRIDTGLPDRADSPLTDAEWQTFLSCAVETQLYIEYMV